MMHLTDDQLYHLAELSSEAEPFNYEEREQFEHLKACKDCFEKYCVFATILDATSLNCSLVFEPVDSMQMVENRKSNVSTPKLLAVIKVTYNRIQNVLSLLGEQIQQETASFFFEPILATATRGDSDGKKTKLCMEDVENENTFVVYDAEEHKLLIQLDIPEKDLNHVRVYLRFNDQSILDIPLKLQGTSIRGMLTDVPERNFDIFIEEN